MRSWREFGVAYRLRVVHTVCRANVPEVLLGVRPLRAQWAPGAALRAAVSAWRGGAAHPGRRTPRHGRRGAFIVADHKSGHILAASHAQDKLQVASLTKIATAVVVLDWVRLGGHTLDQMASVPAAALADDHDNPVGFQAGDEVTLRDLLYAALLQSDNIAADTLAAFVGRDLPGDPGVSPTARFVVQMNALARKCTRSTPVSSTPPAWTPRSGPFPPRSTWPGITRKALDKADFNFFVAQKERRITLNRAGAKSDYLLRNTNELLGVDNVDGGKTGQTDRAGACLMVTSERTPIVWQEGGSRTRPRDGWSSSCSVRRTVSDEARASSTAEPISTTNGWPPATPWRTAALKPGSREESRIVPLEPAASVRESMNKKRIGILTSGGDCPGLNAVIRGVVRAADNLDWEVVGFIDGFEGLLAPGDYRILDRHSTAQIMPQGGTILGTTNKGHFISKIGAGDKVGVAPETVENARDILAKLRIEGLILVGGDGSLTTGLQLFEAGFPSSACPRPSTTIWRRRR